MKICHVITRMIIGGAQENTLFSCQGQVEAGHEVTLITGPTTGPEGTLLDKQKVPGLKVIELPSLIRELNPMVDWKAHHDLKRIFKEMKFDIVHTHASKAGIVGRTAAWAAKVPGIIHTVHGPAFHRYEKPWKNRLYIGAEKFAAKRCHKILCVADAMTQQFVDAKIAKPDFFRTIYSGMELGEYLQDSDGADIRQKLDIPMDALVIGKVARLFELKGHEFIIEAAKETCKKFPKVVFVFVGNGLLHDELKAEIEKAGLEKHFRFAGLIPPTEVPRYIKAMDIVCHLSLREGLPRAVVQGLASAKPVVGYALDGSPEVILNDKTGFLCPAESIKEVVEAFDQLLSSEDLRKEYGANGRQLVKERFDWRVMCRHLEEEYLAALN